MVLQLTIAPSLNKRCVLVSYTKHGYCRLPACHRLPVLLVHVRGQMQKHKARVHNKPVQHFPTLEKYTVILWYLLIFIALTGTNSSLLQCTGATYCTVQIYRFWHYPGTFLVPKIYPDLTLPLLHYMHYHSELILLVHPFIWK